MKILVAVLATANLAFLMTSCVVDVRPPAQTTTVESVHTPGYAIATLPAGYTTVTHRGVRYYQAGGVYYRPAARGYTVVHSPF